jgi:tetratricopeptide (TPR) repeat protein
MRSTYLCIFFILALVLPLAGACTIVQACAWGAQSSVAGSQNGVADPELVYMGALRDRKLYRVLESYCREQLSRQDVTGLERARYTKELADLLAIRAQAEPSANVRSELWQQAATALSTFLEQNAGHPQAGALQFQLGVYELAQGELARQQAKLDPQNNEMLETAQTHLRAAVQSFRQVESETTQTMKKRAPGDTPADDQPTYKQLTGLLNNVRFRLGQALLALAQSYPRHSADQTEAASQAKTYFDAFTQRPSTNELTMESYFGRAECLRLIAEPTDALKSLSELTKPGTPDKYYDRYLVLRAQLQLDQKNPASARNIIEDSRKLLKAPSPEMDLLYVQSLLELARQQSRGKEDLVARQLVAAALKEIDRIEKEHGAYWVTRCELLLAELAAENILVDDLGVLVRMADGQFRRRDLRGMVKTLDRAVKLANEQGDAKQCVDLMFRAASVLVQEKQHEAAAERFAQIARTFPNHPSAPQAEFMITYCLGQLYAADPTPERLERYERSLEQHLNAFGADETALEVRWLLGSLRMSQRRWMDAIELFRGIPSQHREFLPARDQIRLAYESSLQELWQRNQPADQVQADALQFLKRVLADRRNQWKASDVPFALSLARIELAPRVGRFAEAEELLSQVLFGQVASDAERAEARRLIVAALVGQDKFDEARQMIETEFVGLPQELFSVVQAMEETAAFSSELRRRQFGKLQLVATERLVRGSEQLTAEQILQAEIHLALAYVNAGESARADELFAKLRDRVANDPRVLEAQAECFMQLGRYSQARDLWRQLLGLLRENSPAWYRAKYNLALACFKLGDTPQALKIILVTEQLHPELGGPDSKAKFDELKAKCRAN